MRLGVMVLADPGQILFLSPGPSGEVLRAMASMDWDDYLRHEAAMWQPGGPGPGFQGLARANGLSLPPAVVGKSHPNHFYMFR